MLYPPQTQQSINESDNKIVNEPKQSIDEPKTILNNFRFKVEELKSCPGYYITKHKPYRIFHECGVEVEQECWIDAPRDKFVELHHIDKPLEQEHYLYDLIAEQFIPNPHNYDAVIYRRGKRAPRSILKRLYWVPTWVKQNGWQFREDFDDYAVTQVVYDGVTYKNLYYDNKKRRFYKPIDAEYKVFGRLYVDIDEFGQLFITADDGTKIYINKFYQQHGIICSLDPADNN